MDQGVVWGYYKRCAGPNGEGQLKTAIICIHIHQMNSFADIL